MVQIKTLQRENSKKLKSISETRRTALLPSGKRLKRRWMWLSMVRAFLCTGKRNGKKGQIRKTRENQEGKSSKSCIMIGAKVQTKNDSISKRNNILE